MDKDCKSKSLLNGAAVTEEVNLPEVVAGFKMLAVNKPDEENPVGQRRSLRKRKPRTDFDMSTLNRRCIMKPKKRSFSEMENEDQIKEYYLDKTIKKHANSLETIFEEKEETNQTNTYMSVKRFKRMIQFTTEPTDSKLKKRRERIKKVFGSKINHKRRKNVSMQTLLSKLNSLQNDLSVNSKNGINK